MSIYTEIANQNWEALKGKLKPTTCESCRGDGFNSVGTCKRCLENQAYNREYMETHLFETYDNLSSYHNYNHDAIKQMSLRKKNENPFLYYGIELEIEFDRDYLDTSYCNEDEYYDEDDEHAQDEMDNVNVILRNFTEITHGLFVYETDSSLNNGIEFISRPCSYLFWTDKDTVKMLRDGMEYLKAHGALVEQPIGNGMHIHISKKFFEYGKRNNPDYEDAGKSYENFDWLFQKFQPEIEKLGERRYTIYCASKIMDAQRELDTVRNRIGNTLENVKLSGEFKKGGTVGYENHHCAVNSTTKTIEARVFKSTIDVETILARIEIIRNFAHAVREKHSEKPLNEILHTKDNLYLDNYIQKVKMMCKKTKEDFDLEKINTGIIKIEA